MQFKKCIVTLPVLVVAVAAYAARTPGMPLKPGFNLCSKEQDVQLGEANAKQVTTQYQVANNQLFQDYVRHVGSRLAAAPEARQSGFEFRFTVLNVSDINAFALPGGPMFIYSELMACDNEARRWPEGSEKLSGGSAPILIESGWQTFRRENRRETKLPHPG